MRPDHELEDNPTMHPDHELPGKAAQVALPVRTKKNALLKALLFGTLLTIILWIVLVFSSQTINQVYVVLLFIGPIWVVVVTLLYRTLRR